MIVDRTVAERELRAAIGDSLTGQILVAIAYEPTGIPLQVRSLASELVPAAAEQALTAIAAALKDLPPGQVPGTRLLLTLGQPIGLNAEPASYCPPTRREQPSGPMRELIATTTEPAPATIRIPPAIVMVGPDGQVEQVDLERSSGVRDLDEAQIRRIKTWTFHPALVDGFPVRARATER